MLNALHLQRIHAGRPSGNNQTKTMQLVQMTSDSVGIFGSACSGTIKAVEARYSSLVQEKE